ncbi:FAD-dependent oxidoreductase [Thalassoglobus polymorphus]|uniref:Glutamate synthase subunit beta n=1 Tax=Thalassoglobus polymorphus TaxID=2527994 RepID=A0A517QIE1_9PLAN|nr:FAD-dependent oxidoreductase [Thalassoglobus polymorphus]QDT31403.1 glutamate synthase subunit beta [Thalassoglobus polymorphus]
MRTLILLSFCLLTTVQLHAKESPTKTDVLVYGATPAGIAAALNAARDGQSVVMITQYQQIGGLVTNGLSNTDFHTFEGLTGTFGQFSNRVHEYYVQKLGEDHEDVKNALRGTRGEPHINQKIFHEMLSEEKSISILTQTRLVEVLLNPAENKIQLAEFTDRSGQKHQFQAQIYIDATYEGDLMAAAKVPYRVGREGRDEFGESLAPESADDEVQGYNFRFVMTQNPENRVPLEAPQGYDAEMFAPVIPLLKDGTIKTVFCSRKGGLYKAHLPPLPNQKHDINDVSRNAVRLSLPQINNAWPDGDEATRQEIFDRHLLHNIGLLYFVQTDPRVPEVFQEEANTWGWCKDEFEQTDHIPEQLYIREARRMVGQHIYTQQDCLNEKEEARARFHPNSIAIGEYSLNCHGTGHEGPMIGGKHTGEFYMSTPPYQVPYGVICPKEMQNLLVPVAVSASHVGFCSLRLEPIWTGLGDAAGTAAALAIKTGQPVQNIKPRDIQKTLHQNQTATIYVSDVPTDHPDFAAVQWWGSLGGLHGLEKKPSGSPRGKHRLGQYYEYYLGHDVNLDQPLDSETRQRWKKICVEYELPINIDNFKGTRGDFIRHANQTSN